MYSFKDFFETGTVEQVARGQFYAAALSAAVAQKASRAADARLLHAALTWAATCPELPPCPDALKAWGPDHPDALPTEPPSGAAGKEAATHFRVICQHLANWPRSADGMPVGPESVTRRPSAATVEFLAGLPTEEADVIRALAAAAVRFGDRTRQKAASGSRKKAGQADSGASGSRKAEAETGQAGQAGQAEDGPQRPDTTGLDEAAKAAALIEYAHKLAAALQAAAEEAEVATRPLAEAAGDLSPVYEAHAALTALCRKAEAAVKTAALAAERAKTAA